MPLHGAGQPHGGEQQRRGAVVLPAGLGSRELLAGHLAQKSRLPTYTAYARFRNLMRREAATVAAQIPRQAPCLAVRRQSGHHALDVQGCPDAVFRAHRVPVLP